MNARRFTYATLHNATTFCIYSGVKEIWAQLWALIVCKQTNSERILRKKSFKNFHLDYNGLCLKIPGPIFEKFQKWGFWEKLIILTDFWHFRKLKDAF